MWRPHLVGSAVIYTAGEREKESTTRGGEQREREGGMHSLVPFIYFVFLLFEFNSRSPRLSDESNKRRDSLATRLQVAIFSCSSCSYSSSCFFKLANFSFAYFPILSAAELEGEEGLKSLLRTAVLNRNNFAHLSVVEMS